MTHDLARPILSLSALIFAASLALAACEPGEEEGNDDADEGDDTGAIDEDAVVADALDYANLTRINLNPFFSQHSGVDEVNVYVLPNAVDDYKSIDPNDPSAVTFAEGTLIVKEHISSGEATAVTIMFKGPAGYDPEHNDWWWGMSDLEGNLLNAGPAVSECVGCHIDVSGTDFVYGIDPSNQQ